jgi:hypothetical protein
VPQITQTGEMRTLLRPDLCRITEPRLYLRAITQQAVDREPRCFSASVTTYQVGQARKKDLNAIL